MARPLKRELTGIRFGKLRVLRRAKFDAGINAWECVCDCGRPTLLVSSALTSGKTKSCGCLRGEFNRRVRTTHGRAGTPLYRVWCGMRNRCHNPNQPHYERYGGRGIYVCKEWRESFEQFLKDMGERPIGPTGKPYTIERIDNDGPYSPENCCWIPHHQQTLNQRPRRARRLSNL